MCYKFPQWINRKYFSYPVVSGREGTCVDTTEKYQCGHSTGRWALLFTICQSYRSLMMIIIGRVTGEPNLILLLTN